MDAQGGRRALPKATVSRKGRARSCAGLVGTTLVGAQGPAVET